MEVDKFAYAAATTKRCEEVFSSKELINNNKRDVKNGYLARERLVLLLGNKTNQALSDQMVVWPGASPSSMLPCVR